jgi:hypothetical protein
MHLTTKRPGHRKGTANPLSSSLAYSLHEISAAVIALAKIALLAQAKQPRLSATLVRNKTPAPPELWMKTASAFWRGSPVGASRHLSSFSCAANIAG